MCLSLHPDHREHTPDSPSLHLSLLFGVLLLITAVPAGAQELPEELNRILADWQRRQASVFSVRYELLGKGLVPKGSLASPFAPPPGSQPPVIPKEDFVYDKSITWLLDFKGNRMRKETRDQTFMHDDGVFAPYHHVSIYDGSMSQHYIPKESNASSYHKPQPGNRMPEVGLVSNGNNIECSFADYPVFLTQGIVFPSELLVTVIRPERARPPLDARTLTLLGRRFLDDRECLVVKVTPASQGPGVFDELWIASASPSLILRADIHLNGWIDTRLDIQYDSATAAPKGWTTTTYFDAKGKVRKVDRLVVKQYSVNPVIAPEEFRIPLAPGMRVRKADAKGDPHSGFGIKDYRVQQDGVTLVAIDDNRQVRPSWVLWSMLLVLLLLSLLLCWKVWRRKKAARIPA